MFEDHQGHDVAGVGEVAGGVDHTIHRFKFWGGGPFPWLDIFSKRLIAHVRERATAGHVVAAPAFWDWAGVIGEEATACEVELTRIAGEDRADEDAGCILCASGAVTRHAVGSIAGDLDRLVPAWVFDQVEICAEGCVVDNHLDVSAGDVSNVGVFAEENGSRVVGSDKVVLFAGFGEDQNLGRLSDVEGFENEAETVERCLGIDGFPVLEIVRELSD